MQPEDILDTEQLSFFPLFTMNALEIPTKTDQCKANHAKCITDQRDTLSGDWHYSPQPFVVAYKLVLRKSVPQWTRLLTNDRQTQPLSDRIDTRGPSLEDHERDLVRKSQMMSQVMATNVVTHSSLGLVSDVIPRWSTIKIRVSLAEIFQKDDCV